ncbi:acyl-CoA reductase-like NAD-dependent aldehyde dehydrogenase [Rhizobium redzepovicii]
MRHSHSFYIDGKWVEPSVSITLEVIDPSTEEPMGTIALGSAADTEKAVAAAQRAFASFSQTSKEERVELLRRIVTILKRRNDELGDIISREMGAPLAMARAEQAGIGATHFEQTIKALESFAFDYMQGTTCIMHEPIGVVAMITPWNWPINQIACKVAPALATGCTMVLKPSEIAPFNAVLFAEIMDEAGVPKGVFNLVQGDGPTVGAALASPPGCGYGVLHRVDARRHCRGAGGGTDRQASASGARRQVAEHHPAQRRFLSCGRRRRTPVLRQFRPDLYVANTNAGVSGANGRSKLDRRA